MEYSPFLFVTLIIILSAIITFVLAYRRMKREEKLKNHPIVVILVSTAFSAIFWSIVYAFVYVWLNVLTPFGAAVVSILIFVWVGIDVVRYLRKKIVNAKLAVAAEKTDIP